MVFAIALCALAVLFAVEAKVGGYQLDRSQASGIHAAKAWPGESSRGMAARPALVKEAAFLSFLTLWFSCLPRADAFFVRLRLTTPPALHAVLDTPAVFLHRRPPPAL